MGTIYASCRKPSETPLPCSHFSKADSYQAARKVSFRLRHATVGSSALAFPRIARPLDLATQMLRP